MSWLNIKNFLKQLWLYVIRGIRHFFKNIGFKLSLIFVICSLCVSVFLLIPSAFSRVPVFSYFISTMELPLFYQFEGEISLVDSNSELVKQNIDVFIGGYKLEINSGEKFILDFSSPLVDYFYVTIEYENSNREKLIFTQKIETNNEINIKKEIKIYV